MISWRRWGLRLESLISLAVVLLPFALTSILGFVWLFEKGWFLPFTLSVAVLSLCAWLLKLSLRASAPAPSQSVSLSGSNRDWSPAAQAAYDAALLRITQTTQAGLDWSQILPFAHSLLHDISKASRAKTRDPLSFTLPEALLLTETVAHRLRTGTHKHLPFIETLTLAQAYWLWNNRENGKTLWKVGDWGWRAFRLYTNPLQALAQEAQRQTGGFATASLSQDAQALVQQRLLSEAARAATDLYFGYLRLSDSELARLRQQDAARDETRRAPEDQALRVVLVGQTSAGKSSLLNALLGQERGEVDLLAATDKAQSYETEIGGQKIRLIDTPGLRLETQEATLASLKEADLVIWVLKANRPAREADRALFALWQDWAAKAPERRMAPLQPVLTWVDALLPDWDIGAPLSMQESETLASLIERSGAALGPQAPAPLPVVLKAPGWNIDRLKERLTLLSGEALMVQRNRARLSHKATGLSKEITRASASLKTGGQLAWEYFKKKR